MRTLYAVSLAYGRATTAHSPSLGEAAVSVKNTDGRRRIYKKNGAESVTERERGEIPGWSKTRTRHRGPWTRSKNRPRLPRGCRTIRRTYLRFMRSNAMTAVARCSRSLFLARLNPPSLQPDHYCWRLSKSPRVTWRSGHGTETVPTEVREERCPRTVAYPGISYAKAHSLGWSGYSVQAGKLWFDSENCYENVKIVFSCFTRYSTSFNVFPIIILIVISNLKIHIY